MPDKPRRSKKKRQERIIAELMATSTLRVSELAAELRVSTETIRRDLFDLSERGLINRTYGGAVKPLSAEPTVSERHGMLVPEREALALAAVKLFKPGDVVAIGAGATTTHVARRMAAECRDLTVITHSFSVATVLSQNPTITVLMCPGRYDAREGIMVGAEAVEFLQAYNANWALLGATGITAEGVSDADAAAASVYKAMMTRAAATIIVADHTKFDRHALSIWAHWHDVAHIVTDAPIGNAIARALERARVDVILTGKRS